MPRKIKERVFGFGAKSGSGRSPSAHLNFWIVGARRSPATLKASWIADLSNWSVTVSAGIGNLRLAILILGCLCLYACGAGERVEVDIPAGMASLTLKEFAKQTQMEIIFNAADIGGIQTRAVSGRMDPETALKAMLSGTALFAERDRDTGAFAVTHSGKPELAVN